MRAWAVLSLLIPAVVSAAPKDLPPEVAKVAEAYLNALSGAGSDEGRELLLGGATMNAQLFILENWRIKSRDPVRSETGALSSAQKLIRELDASGQAAMTQMLEGAGEAEMTQISRDEATRLMAPTKARAKAFTKAHPVLAFVTRVGKEVYWHPQNPMRPLLARAGNSGKYQVQVHLLNIESLEGPRKVPRVWPLRIVRFQAGSLDTGWRVLPASDWNAE